MPRGPMPSCWAMPLPQAGSPARSGDPQTAASTGMTKRRCWRAGMSSMPCSPPIWPGPGTRPAPAAAVA